ncbi:lipopolysaccharide biosynthesis protein [Aporhodopirellula aestuarii]|uniref:Oligosaccharide flippase family protein n=1 Tax=Aporhodopirellula aestuarii TaxID=2950107 RepID=A0ABT0UAR2_9BACT|nr:oligosaccharide flippase family protein [Aporhodopirellula aestuarii]MCM2374062.1 oligosaccharide flippase family protein [Aporhodopirellula aestuarii]
MNDSVSAAVSDRPHPVDIVPDDISTSTTVGRLRSRADKLGKFGSFVQTVGFAFAIVALQMTQGILLARLLGPEGRGQYATTVLYVQMLLYVGLFGGLEVICRYAAEGKTELHHLRRAAMWLGITTGAITTVLVIACNAFALPDEKRFLMPLGWLCAISVIGQHVMLIMTAVDRGAGKFVAYNVLRFVSAAAFPTLLLIAAIVTEVTLELACVLFVASTLIGMAACLVGLKQPLSGPSEPPVKQLLSESRPYGISMLASDFFERIDLLLVMWLIPLVTQGFYAAMVPVVYPLTVIPNTLGIFLFNAGADESRSLTTRDVHRILGGSIAIQTVSTIAFMMVIGPLVNLVYGAEFDPAVKFALWLAPVSAIKGILQGLDSYVKGRGRPLASIRCRIVAVIAMIIVVAALLESQGAVAIAIAALVGQVICLVWLSAIVYTDVSQSKNSSG